ncbi:hypothetical protein [Vitiosangium sp. GDMCC 1.1324]|uniref:hypothetical protein n=1 Tax=Vitiosangium sp. (strain GDMCC 1.1324) TaxID=2138576 RepID=UPI000D36624A|nr:hypothetical protein [Vitiosangium sp. GDMCC 1.1324]PTL80732.1 hypothetical protein DAT35_25605 [Vitiosangium sp. GDMCC 1.1324]
MHDRNHLNFSCKWQFGFSVRSELKGTVGYLLDWSGCGGLNLKRNIEVWNPFSNSGQKVVSGRTIKCIGLIDYFRYAAGPTDPICIKAYVSKETASDIRSRLARPLTNPRLKLAWYIIDFDEADKLWFEAAYLKSPKTAEASLDSTGGDLQIFVDNHHTRISDTLDIAVFGFEFQVVPADKKKCTLEFATGSKLRLVKQWGTGK